MRRALRRCSVAFLFAALAMATSAAAPFTFHGKVIALADGDTLRILTAEKRQYIIRLNGIDAPEAAQAFSQVSKRHLSDLVFGKDVEVSGSKIDRYGRYVGTVVINGTDANLEQLRAGLAWYYRDYATDVPADKRGGYEGAEAEARAAKRGIWSDPHPSPPWDFRHPGPESVLPATAGRIIGNRNSRIYHLTNCPDYAKVAERNRQYFASREEAERAGFRQARNCP